GLTSNGVINAKSNIIIDESEGIYWGGLAGSAPRIYASDVSDYIRLRISSTNILEANLTGINVIGIVSATGGDSDEWNIAYADHITGIGFATGTGILTLTQQDGGTLTESLDGRYLTLDSSTDFQLLSEKDAIDGYAGLDSSGKINPSQLPALAITDTFVVNSEAAMLALTVEVGDVAVRTDLNKTYILKVTGATVLANWQELLTPTDAVTSVFGRNGVVTAQNNDYTWAQINKTTSSLADITTRNFSDLQNIPTTLSGYGITNAYTKTETDGKYLLNTTDTFTGTLTLVSLDPNTDLIFTDSSGSGTFKYNGASDLFTAAANLDIGGSLDVTGTVTADTTITVVGTSAPTVQARSLKNGTWVVGEPLGAYDFYSSDSSGGGAGVKAKMEAYVSAGNTGSRIGLKWYTEDSTFGLTPKMTLNEVGVLTLLEDGIVTNGVSTFNGSINVIGTVTADAFDASQPSTSFLKGDGSFDTNTYLTSETDTLASVTARGATTTSDITVGSLTVQDGSNSNILLKAGTSLPSNNALLIYYKSTGASSWYIGQTSDTSTFAIYNYDAGHKSLEISRTTSKATFIAGGSFGDDLSVTGTVTATDNVRGLTMTTDRYLLVRDGLGNTTGVISDSTYWVGSGHNFCIGAENGKTLRLSAGGSVTASLTIETDGRVTTSTGLDTNGGLTSSSVQAFLASATGAYIDMNNGTYRTYFQNDSGSNRAYYYTNLGSHTFSTAVSVTGAITVNDAVSRIYLNAASVNRGSVYANQSNEFGFLDKDGDWFYKGSHDSEHEWFVNNVELMTLNSNGLNVTTQSSAYLILQSGGATSNDSLIIFRGTDGGNDWWTGQRGDTEPYEIYNYGHGGVGATALSIAKSTSNATFVGSVTATSLVKTGGTSSQFLKADGSVDTNTYLTSSDLSGYAQLSGATFTGTVTATTVVKSGGTSSQYLMADGSVVEGGGGGAAGVWKTHAAWSGSWKRTSFTVPVTGSYEVRGNTMVNSDFNSYLTNAIGTSQTSVSTGLVTDFQIYIPDNAGSDKYRLSFQMVVTLYSGTTYWFHTY
ncbi:MAG: hypothetical protein K0U52_11830, partial [Gammaproteobacteria bacterium]|nr:hypothetical protein [Gammaproteobacteria bacterium]